jgi:O-acetylserine/cysteine efflux transporter
MKRQDLILALLVVIIWGANFTVIKLGLAGMPPMLLAVLRYTFAALPAIAFVKRPSVEWKYIFAYGMTVGVGQFSCLFYAMNIGMPAGVSSVVLQSQAFFTLIFASIMLKESLKKSQIIGFLVSGGGLCLIGGNIGGNGLSSIPVGAFLLTLIAAAFWGISNIIIRYASKQAASDGKTIDMLSMVVWSSLVSPIPFLVIALILDTPKTLLHAVGNLSLMSVFSVAYLAFGATLFGYGVWSILLSKYPAGKVAPLSLLVPVTGLIAAQIVLNEQLSTIQWLGGIVIILGLVISNFGFLPIQHIFKAKEL